MSWFWIVGIVLNVGLTLAAIVWVIRQGKPRDVAPKDGARGERAPEDAAGPPGNA